MVRAPDCGSGCRGFDSHLPPFLVGKSIACAMLFFVVSLLGDCRTVKGGRRRRGGIASAEWYSSYGGKRCRFGWSVASLVVLVLGALLLVVLHCRGGCLRCVRWLSVFRRMRYGGWANCEGALFASACMEDSAVGLLGDLCCGCLGCVLAVSSPCGGASCVREVCCYAAGGGLCVPVGVGDKSKSGYPGGITALL